jgi:hypothetical protein
MYEVSVTGTTTDGVNTVVGAATTGSFMLPPANRPEIQRPETPQGNPNVPAPGGTEPVAPPAPQNVTPPGQNQEQRPGRNTAPGQNR